jgi:hypothetical protein
MISDAVIGSAYCNRRQSSIGITNCVVERGYDSASLARVMNTDELLARLEGVRNVDIAKALGLPDSRVPEIRKKQRRLTLDEGATLVRAFGLERDSAATPLPDPVLRLVVQYVALRMGVPEQRIRSLSDDVTADLRAFSEFVSDPKVRRSIEAAEGYFQALLRPRPVSEALPGTDRDPPN